MYRGLNRPEYVEFEDPIDNNKIIKGVLCNDMIFVIKDDGSVIGHIINNLNVTTRLYKQEIAETRLQEDEIRNKIQKILDENSSPFDRWRFIRTLRESVDRHPLMRIRKNRIIVGLICLVVVLLAMVFLFFLLFMLK